MRKHIWDVTRCIAFIVILVLSLNSINRVLTPKYIMKNNTWPTTASYNQFYEMDKDSIDVIFLGASLVANAFIPQELYNEYGIRSYNLGCEQQSVFLSYFWLKEALQYQSPKVVVLDTRFLFELHPENRINTLEGLTRKCLDPMKWSKVKREAISDLCKIDEQQSEMSYYLTNQRFHARWIGLTEYDFVEEEYKYNELLGYAPVESLGPPTYDTYNPGDDKESMLPMQDIMQTYLDKITLLCKEKGITLVLVSLPGSPMDDAYNNTLTSYATANGLDYYNFCETNLYNMIGAELPKENLVDHENIWGATKMTRFVGQILANNYGIPSVTDEQYEQTKWYYEHIKKNCELIYITDMNEYLNYINDVNYTIFISAREEASCGLTDEAMAGLNGLGLAEDLRGKYQWSYAAVISPEIGIIEAIDENISAALSGSFRDKKTFYSVVSGGKNAGSNSSINIEGLEYSRNARGLNVVVYDNVLMKVVDRVTFDTYSACELYR